MKKIDLAKARVQFQQSALATRKIYVTFSNDLNLAEAAKTAKTEGLDYIEIEGWASTPVLNDRGFIIAASAWQHDEAYERLTGNPIVLFVHKQEFPVGQIVLAEGRPEGLWVKLRIRFNAILPTQEKIGDVIADGTLRALSIGIDQILEFEVLEDNDRVTPVVTKLRISEISVCSVGSDMGAITSVTEEFEKIFQLSASAEETKGGITMWKILAAKYGMDPNTVTEEQVMAEYQRRETLGANAIIGLGLDPTNVTAEQLTQALAARDPKQLAKLTATNLVNQAVLAKKIAENDEDTKQFALALAESSPAQFEAWLKLQKTVAPDTRTITGPGAGANLGGRTNDGANPFITKEDREICLSFGVLTPEKMDELAETSPNVAASWVLGQNLGASEKDREVVANRRRWDEACGIPAR